MAMTRRGAALREKRAASAMGPEPAVESRDTPKWDTVVARATILCHKQLGAVGPMNSNWRNINTDRRLPVDCVSLFFFEKKVHATARRHFFSKKIEKNGLRHLFPTAVTALTICLSIQNR